ncbi:hypothetical protein INT43_007823 [Umbelopsis isabellina]|uniref:Uncharacterized protein n=1 Tax=Mortierella isabellina TaxID=91625 RepID=A0A8H7PQ04_MORIS|nr:hypothetical protein INT43_007823 [Umbelopsis isabellina]
MANATLEFAFSIVGLVFWSLQLAPQVWKSWRLKSTEGVSTSMMIIWAIAGVFLGIYNVGAQLAIPLWRHWSTLASISALVAVCIISGVLEYGFITAFKVAEARQVDWVHWLFGVIPVVLIIVGFLPQYWDIFATRKVHGISHVFLTMDFLGTFRETFDVLDAINYIAVAVLDIGIMALYYFFEWYNARAAKILNQLDADTDSDHTCALDDIDQAHADANSTQTYVSDELTAKNQPK